MIYNCFKGLLTASFEVGVEIQTISGIEGLNLYNEIFNSYRIATQSNDAISMHRVHVWTLVPLFVDEAEVLFVIQPGKIVVYKSGKDLEKVLHNFGPCDPWLFTDRQLSYFLETNDHDYIVAYGRAVSWLKEIISHNS